MLRTFAPDGPVAVRGLSRTFAAFLEASAFAVESRRSGACCLYFRRYPVAKAQKNEPLTERIVKPDEIKKLDAYFKRLLNPQVVVKARPRKNDSAEVYLGEEFLGVIYVDDEDGDRSYNFSMAILDVDL
jgi:Protein of unknown function (DUF3126)